MVNASDLFKNNLLPLKNLKRLFPNINKKISFVRFACHYDEIFGLGDCIKWLSKNKVSVFINIMQISEINLDKLKKVLLNLSKTNIKALYFADSLGALDIKKFKQLIQITNKYWKKDLGLHAMTI